LKDATANFLRQQLSESEAKVRDLRQGTLSEGEERLQDLNDRIAKANAETKFFQQQTAAYIREAGRSFTGGESESESLSQRLKDCHSRLSALELETAAKDSALSLLREQLAESEAELRTRDDRIQALGALEKFNIELRQELSRVSALNAALDEKIATIQATSDADYAEFRRLSEAERSLQQRLDAIHAEKAALSEMNVEAKRKLESAEALVGSQRTEIEVLRSTAGSQSTWKEQVIELKTQNKGLAREIERLKESLRKSGDDDKLAEASQRELVAIAGMFNVEIFDLRTVLGELVADNTRKAETVSECERTISSLEKSMITVSGQQHASQQAKIENLENRIREKDRQLSAAENERREMADALRTVDSFDSHELVDIVGPMNSEIFDLRSELARFTEKYRDVRVALRDKIEELNGQFVKMNSLDLVNAELRSHVHALREVEAENLALQRCISELQTVESDLRHKLKVASREREIVEQRLTSASTYSQAVDQLMSEADAVKTKCQAQEEEIRQLRALKNVNGEKDRAIERLEDERLELKSRISVLEAEMQLRTVQKHDADVLKLEMELKQAQREVEDHRQLINKNTELTKTLEHLKTANRAFDLRVSELENALANAERVATDFDQTAAENARLNRERIAVQSVKDEFQSLDLKAEQLAHEVEERTTENARLSADLESLRHRAEDAESKIAAWQVESTQSDVEHLKNRSELIRVQGEITKCQSHIRALQTERDTLNATIDRLNKRHEFELDALNTRVKAIADGGSDVQAIDIVARVNREYSELMSKYRQVQSALRNEAAEHAGSKNRILELESLVRATKSKYGQIETDHTCLVQTLVGLFHCSTQLSEIVVAVSKSAREHNEIAEIRRRMSQNENEMSELRSKPALLQCELSRMRSWLELEQKKTQILEMRNASFSKADTLALAVSQFLEVVIRESDDERIKRVASCLVKGADLANWGKFAHLLVAGPKAALAVSEKAMCQMSQKLDAMVERCENFIAKARFAIARTNHRRKEPTAPVARARIPLAPLGNARTPLPKRIPFDVPRRLTPAGVEPPSTNSVY
jgi:chromosome segregation ATPase